MTNIIEKIEEIEITDEMLKAHYEGAGKTKTGMPVIYTVSDSIKRAIQASTQIAELIAENKRLRYFVTMLANQAITENEFKSKDIDIFHFRNRGFHPKIPFSNFVFQPTKTLVFGKIRVFQTKTYSAGECKRQHKSRFNRSNPVQYFARRNVVWRWRPCFGNEPSRQ